MKLNHTGNNHDNDHEHGYDSILLSYLEDEKPSVPPRSVHGTVGVPRVRPGRSVERTCVCPSTTLRIRPFGPGRA